MERIDLRMHNNIEQEEWKDVIGYEGLYKVSNLGRVRSLNRTIADGRKYKGKLLKQRNDRVGYKDIMLSNNGNQTRYKVHRLVAIAFLPNPNSLPQVNHIDENKANNHLNNLEWCSAKENINHSFTDEKREKMSKRHGREILAISSDGKIKKFNSIKNAALKLGVKRSGIYQNLNGEISHHHGYIFKDVMEVVS